MPVSTAVWSETEGGKEEKEKQEAPESLGGQGLSSFFSRSRKSKLAARLNVSCSGGVSTEDADAESSSNDRIWLSIRPWVCLHALVASQRAFPVCDLACEDWEQEGASERAVLAHERRQSSSAADAFAWTAALVVSLPPECLARALEFIHGDVSTVFAPVSRTFPRPGQTTQEAKANQRNWQCCRYLLSQRSCLHGRVLQSGRGRSLSVACWYLGSPVVPFSLFLFQGSLNKVTNPKKGALIIIWLLGYP